jgi:hypothetical protein
METTKCITKEQLEEITNQQTELSNLLTNIGLHESQKHSLLHKLAEVNKRVEDFKSELFKQYGDVNINIEDGSYSKIEASPELQLVKE